MKKTQITDFMIECFKLGVAVEFECGKGYKRRVLGIEKITTNLKDETIEEYGIHVSVDVPIKHECRGGGGMMIPSIMTIDYQNGESSHFNLNDIEILDLYVGDTKVVKLIKNIIEKIVKKKVKLLLK